MVAYLNLGSLSVVHASAASTAYAPNATNNRFINVKPGAQGRIRTSVARKERQIYSLLPLTTRPPVHKRRAIASLPRPGTPTVAVKDLSRIALHKNPQQPRDHASARLTMVG